MNLIQKISLTLKTWVFKNKILKFSSKFSRDPQACFYCPEMCRFSCPTAETLKSNAITPRGKMSLLHHRERGVSSEELCGSAEQKLWYLDQCTGCGRCTEFCLHEVDVASNLREERARVRAELGQKSELEKSLEERLKPVQELRGKVLVVEEARIGWWKENFKRFHKINCMDWIAFSFAADEWQQGLIGLESESLKKIATAFSHCTELVFESPEMAWFFAKALKEDTKLLKPEVRLLWQYLFPVFISNVYDPDTIVHESFHLSRLLPRLGYSIPMYEKGFLPFHFGWNSYDCGGEGFYKKLYPEVAAEMGERFFSDLKNDGRELKKIIVQNLKCKDHLHDFMKQKSVEMSYWLDEVVLSEF